MTKRKKKKEPTIGVTGSVYVFPTSNPNLNNLTSSLVDYVLIDSNRINIAADLFRQEDEEGKYYSILKAFFEEFIDNTITISDYPTTQIISIVEAHDLLKELLNCLPDSAWLHKPEYSYKPLEALPMSIGVFNGFGVEIRRWKS